VSTSSIHDQLTREYPAYKAGFALAKTLVYGKPSTP
jgi:hypothetical protein